MSSNGRKLIRRLPRHAQVTATLPCAQTSWNWSVTATNRSLALRFPLSSLPAILNNDIGIAVIILAGSGSSSSLLPSLPRTLPMKWRRLMRAPPPVGDGEAASVQVDHHSRALRVNGSFFVGHGAPNLHAHFITLALQYFDLNGRAGWYVYGNHAMGIDELFAPVRQQAEIGISMVMPYALYEYDEATQLQYLDSCHEAGVKVLYDVSRLGFSATGAALPIADNYTNDWASEAWVAAVKGNVSLVNEHPAIMAFYICDGESAAHT